MEKSDHDILRKGDEDMQCVLEQKSVSGKLNELKKKAELVKTDSKLRHDITQHDIDLTNENTELLFSHQIKTIRGED
jgi:hypothetical protein